MLVTEGCQGCLAHPARRSAPKDAIKLDRYNGRSHIDPGKCINCGRCADVCSYKAIIIQERPCAVACGMDAIGTDANGKAEIDQDKCVSCGMCLVTAPSAPSPTSPRSSRSSGPSSPASGFTPRWPPPCGPVRPQGDPRQAPRRREAVRLCRCL